MGNFWTDSRLQALVLKRRERDPADVSAFLLPEEDPDVVADIQKWADMAGHEVGRNLHYVAVIVIP